MSLEIVGVRRGVVPIRSDPGGEAITSGPGEGAVVVLVGTALAAAATTLGGPGLAGGAA
jgi:hypothetical protein